MKKRNLIERRKKLKEAYNNELKKQGILDAKVEEPVVEEIPEVTEEVVEEPVVTKKTSKKKEEL